MEREGEMTNCEGARGKKRETHLGFHFTPLAEAANG